MKMSEVCSLFENIGMKEVSSVLASGNIIFFSDFNTKKLKPLLEETLSNHYNYDAFLFIKEKEEIAGFIKNTPFETHPDFHIYGFIGVDGVQHRLLEEFENSKKVDGEAAQIKDNNFYWTIPKGKTLESNFGKILGRKNMKDSFTSRNLNTFEKIFNKM